MIDGSEKRNRQLAFELQNSHVCEKRSKYRFIWPRENCYFEKMWCQLQYFVIIGFLSLKVLFELSRD